jgi:hypothetical protein
MHTQCDVLALIRDRRARFLFRRRGCGFRLHSGDHSKLKLAFGPRFQIVLTSMLARHLYLCVRPLLAACMPDGVVTCHRGSRQRQKLGHLACSSLAGAFFHNIAFADVPSVTGPPANTSSYWAHVRQCAPINPVLRKVSRTSATAS